MKPRRFRCVGFLHCSSLSVRRFTFCFLLPAAVRMPCTNACVLVAYIDRVFALQLTYLLSDEGIPADYRHMNGEHLLRSGPNCREAIPNRLRDVFPS